MSEMVEAPDWDQVRYRQGYIRAMFDLQDLTKLSENYEETQ